MVQIWSYVIGDVTTYSTMGVWMKSLRRVFQKEKRVGVATNVYSRKTLEKLKRGLRILKIRIRECLLMGKVLAPHTPVTRDGSL